MAAFFICFAVLERGNKMNHKPTAAELGQKPAVPPEESITPNYLVCLEDGKKLKVLTRHIRHCYNLTPEEYREKWGLPRDYPMMLESYAVARLELERKMKGP